MIDTIYFTLNAMVKRKEEYISIVIVSFSRNLIIRLDRFLGSMHSCRKDGKLVENDWFLEK